MISRILNPRLALVLAMILGLSVGPLIFWRGADAIVSKILAERQAALALDKEKADEQKAHGWDFWTVEMENLSTELKEEKGRLAKKTEELNRRLAQLEVEKGDLARTRAEIESMRQTIDERVITIKADEGKNLKSLAVTYSNITAPAAVSIIKELDDTTAVKILSFMKPDIVGPIFEAMATSSDATMAHRAAVLSDKLRLIKTAQAAATTASR
jgi:flagellar motility protein MotE (MotC chaperone)